VVEISLGINMLRYAKGDFCQTTPNILSQLRKTIGGLRIIRILVKNLN
jgi:hypothetical protein